MVTPSTKQPFTRRPSPATRVLYLGSGPLDQRTPYDLRSCIPREHMLSGGTWISSPSRFSVAPRTMDEHKLIPAYYQDFRDHVQTNLKNGENCQGDRFPYISYVVLKNYWTTQRIQSMLRAILQKASHFSANDIHEHYLIPLSVIVYMSTSRESFLDELHTFIMLKLDDGQVPLREQPEHLSNDFWQAFSKRQWHFCPLKLGSSQCHDRYIDRRCIFPGIETPFPGHIAQATGRSRGSNKATLKLMTVEPPGTGLPHNLVRKTFKSSILK